MELNEADCSGHPITAVTQELVQHAEELIQNDWLITTRKLITEIQVSKGTVNNTTDTLTYSKVCTCWVPSTQTYYQKIVHEEVFSDLFSCYEADGESFWSQIITGVGTWFH